MKYTIIQAHSTNYLSQEVNRYLDNGWRLYRGVVTVPHGDTLYLQCMVLTNQQEQHIIEVAKRKSSHYCKTCTLKGVQINRCQYKNQLASDMDTACESWTDEIPF